MTEQQRQALEILQRARNRLLAAKAKVDASDLDEETRDQLRSVADASIVQADVELEAQVGRWLRTL